MKLLAALGGIIAISLLLFGMAIGYRNTEVRQRNLILAKQKDNHNELDNMVKVIGQTAEVSSEQMKSIKDIIVGNSEARKGGSGSLATFVHEAVPNIDTSSKTFQNLQNIIVASRNSWTMRQKELLDLKRVHDNLIDVFPSSLFVGGRGKIDVQIVTSTRAEKAFESGRDDEVTLFKK